MRHRQRTRTTQLNEGELFPSIRNTFSPTFPKVHTFALESHITGAPSVGVMRQYRFPELRSLLVASADSPPGLDDFLALHHTHLSDLMLDFDDRQFGWHPKNNEFTALKSLIIPYDFHLRGQFPSTRYVGFTGEMLSNDSDEDTRKRMRSLNRAMRILLTRTQFPKLNTLGFIELSSFDMDNTALHEEDAHRWKEWTKLLRSRKISLIGSDGERLSVSDVVTHSTAFAADTHGGDIIDTGVKHVRRNHARSIRN